MSGLQMFRAVCMCVKCGEVAEHPMQYHPAHGKHRTGPASAEWMARRCCRCSYEWQQDIPRAPHLAEGDQEVSSIGDKLPC
jgi:hypothetical protein